MKKFLHFWHAVFQHYNATDCNYRAAALTLTTLLSLVPLMTVSLSILAFFPQFKLADPRIQDFIFSNFVVSSGEVIQTYLQNFVNQAMRLSTFGLLFLIVTAIAMMFTIEKTLNAIWHIRKSRHILTALALYGIALILSPILIGVGFAMTSYLAVSWEKLSSLMHPLLAITPFFLSVVGFTVMYTVMPNRKIPLRYGLSGALVTASLFEVAKYVFALYIKHFTNYQILYGALAAIPIFIIWVYLCWIITLFGAVVSNKLMER